MKLIEQKIIPRWYKNLPHGTREPEIDYRGESDEMYKLDVILWGWILMLWLFSKFFLLKFSYSWLVFLCMRSFLCVFFFISNGMHPPPPPAWGGGALKILKKSFLLGGGGSQKFLFWWEESHNFEVKIKIA